jgi:hypothetical protein
MNRVIKFRCWHEGYKGKGRQKDIPARMLYDEQPGDCLNYLKQGQPVTLMQFTGKKCYKEREVYEGDILFYEQEEDGGDVRHYLVVVWIDEWSMFATLFVEEYNTYKLAGAKDLDEGLFWTYTLEDCANYHYAGNIYENPELLQ